MFFYCVGMCGVPHLPQKILGHFLSEGPCHCHSPCLGQVQGLCHCRDHSLYHSPCQDQCLGPSPCLCPDVKNSAEAESLLMFCQYLVHVHVRVFYDGEP